MLKSTDEKFPGFIYNCLECDHEILVTGDRRKPVSEQMQDQIDKLTDEFRERLVAV